MIRPSPQEFVTVISDAFASLLVVIVAFLYIFDLFWILRIHLFMLTAYLVVPFQGRVLHGTTYAVNT